MEQISDFNTNLELLLAQYSDSVNLKGILRIANGQASDFEVAIFEIRDWMWLETAIGPQLEFIGRVFNEARNGRGDEEFRNEIKLKASLVSSGTPENIIRILRGLYGATEVKYIPGYPGVPASFVLVTDATITEAELNLISPSGVQANIGDFLACLDEAGELTFVLDGHDERIAVI